MKIPIYPSLENICVLVGTKDERGIYRMISESNETFGFHLNVKPLNPLLPQIVEQLEMKLKLSARELNFASEVAEEVKNLSGKDFLLVLTTTEQTLKTEFLTQFHVETYPDLLRRLPQERVRLPFLRVWQILMGSHLEVQKAVVSDHLPH